MLSLDHRMRNVPLTRSISLLDQVVQAFYTGAGEQVSSRRTSKQLLSVAMRAEVINDIVGHSNRMRNASSLSFRKIQTHGSGYRGS